MEEAQLERRRPRVCRVREIRREAQANLGQKHPKMGF